MTNHAWFDADGLKTKLAGFFDQEKAELSKFGSVVNQTFEAFVFAQVISWYRERGWTVDLRNPKNQKTQERIFRLKFSTRGRPENYSFAQCVKDGESTVQVRHQLRVATKAHRVSSALPANVCLDVAVIADHDLSSFGTDDYVANASLVAFGEAKHMSAYAELVAGFVGLVFEMQPARLRRVRIASSSLQEKKHISPFLYVSGHLWKTGGGVIGTLVSRKFDVDVYHKARTLSEAIKIGS